MIKNLNGLDWVAMVLAIVGSLNWGLSALGFNVVDSIFGTMSVISDVIYILVGLAGLYLAFVVGKFARK